MDELLDRTRIFYEWAHYYPRWAQAVFAATAVLVAFSTIVFFAGKKVAAALRETSEFERAVSWSVSIDETLPPVEDPSETGIPDDRALRYTQASNAGGGGMTVVTPVLPYLDRWNTGHEVEALNAGAKRFRWRYPTLDVLAANQAEDPLIVQRIDLLVEESRPEDETAILVLSDYEDLMSVRVVSPIAGELSDLRLSFDVADATTAGPAGVIAHPGAAPATQPLAHRYTLARPTGDDRIPVDDALQAKGAVPILLRTNPKDVYAMFMAGKASEVGSLGPFTKGTAPIRGEFTVRRGSAALGPYRIHSRRGARDARPTGTAKSERDLHGAAQGVRQFVRGAGPEHARHSTEGNRAHPLNTGGPTLVAPSAARAAELP